MTITEKYEEWKPTNPEMMALFERFALDMLARGRRFGIGQLAERVRWEVRMEHSPADGYKVNNNFRANIAHGDEKPKGSAE